jgi:hypothetical protein
MPDIEYLTRQEYNARHDELSASMLAIGTSIAIQAMHILK